MERFVHRFCGASGGMSGPFRAEWRDFSAFDPAMRRDRGLRARVATIVEEDGTSEPLALWWVHEYEGWLQGAHTYRLCVFSNFLAKPESVDAQSDRLSHAFGAVTPGCVVLVMGGVGDRYPGIYPKVESLAAEAGLRRQEVQEHFAPPSAPEPIASMIKRLNRTIWARLDELGHAQTEGLAKLRDVRDPKTPYVTSGFALRLSRRRHPRLIQPL
jgi:hypothetical protein